ncbi:unnamed protein product [Bursaphelenchus xylophilus]|uniref:(pine wood nematode) hypothetical protein n=1 Tax=Bursaphelenchus xylophilus TaxID=6326 RepID=A0A1I7S9V7_BURXY|nr:unnamed protein product [Bursaphelenchus xylophilus]CAG9129271.1 unnamed protein product [Bursaphelenchus xylophilus]
MLPILLPMIFSLVSSSDWVRTESQERVYHKNLNATESMEYDVHIVMKQSPPGDQSGSCVQLSLGHSEPECGIGVCFTPENGNTTKMQLLRGGKIGLTDSHKGKLENVKFTLTRAVTLMTVGEKTVFLPDCSLNEVNYTGETLNISLGFQQKAEGNVNERFGSPWWHTFQLVEIKPMDNKTQAELEEILKKTRKEKKQAFFGMFKNLSIMIGVFVILTAIGSILAIISLTLVVVHIQRIKREDDEELQMDGQMYQEMTALETLVKGNAKESDYQVKPQSPATTPNKK